MQYRQAMSRIPWAILTKFCVAEGFLGPFSSAKFQHYRYSNVGLSSLESQKFLIFLWKKFAIKGGIALNDFYIQN